MTSAPLDEVIRVAIVIDTMIDEAVMVGGMTTALVLLAAMMTMNDEATAAVAGVNEMTAMVVALASTDMKAADATTTMGQVVIDEEVGAMNAEMIVSEAMVAHRLPAMMLLVSPMVVVETILLGTIDMPGDKRHGPKGPAILHYAQPTRRVSCFAQASQFANSLSGGTALSLFWRERHNNSRRKRSDRESQASWGSIQNAKLPDMYSAQTLLDSSTQQRWSSQLAHPQHGCFQHSMFLSHSIVRPSGKSHSWQHFDCYRMH